MQYSINKGSEWGIWDLHFHTPSSYDYDDKSVSNDDIINGLLAHDVKVVAITDHHIIDIDRINALTALAAGKITILPGIEFLSDARGREPVHIIGIFPENANLSLLWDEIRVKTNIAKIYKENAQPHTIYNDLTETCALIHELGGLVTIHAGSRACGIDKITNSLPHYEAQKEDIASCIDIFDMGKEDDLDGYRKNVFPSLKKVYPMILCSDNHNIRKYTVKQNCWIKGTTDFAGLKQIVFEPELRVRIQTSNPDDKLDRLVISEAEFEDTKGLFGKQTIYFNENLNSIIGGKSSGKSLLLHSMANAIDAPQVERISDALKIPRTYFDGHFSLKVKWKDGFENVLSSDKDDKRKITYIPQLYINYLAEKENEEELNSLLINILRQNSTFSSFYSRKLQEISNTTTTIQTMFNDMVNERREALEAMNSLKESGKVEDVKKSIEELKKKIEAITKASSLNQEEQNKYYQFLSYEENQLKWIAYFKAMIELTSRVVSVVETGVYSILGEGASAAPGFSNNKLQSILSLYQLPDDLKKVINDYETNQKQLVIQLKSALANLNYEAKIKNCEQELVKARLMIKPIQDKVISLKDLEVLKAKLQSESSRLEKSIVLEKKFKKTLENYRSFQKCVGDLLSKRFSLYRDVINTVNNKYSNITAEIKLIASMGFSKEESIFYVMVNKNRITDASYFYTLFPKESGSLNTDEVPRFFSSIVSLKDGILKYRLDDKELDSIPLNQGYESIEEVFISLIGDNVKLHFDIQYKNDNLFQMSPGKKGTVLLILFLELSSAEHPIFIDQPEDNLDNRTIYDLLCKMIRLKKQSRQIIIVSHNANLVVATDSENVIVANQLGQSSSTRKLDSKFEYVNGPLELSFDNSSDTSLSELKAKGIKEHVCDILEGGLEAFHNRESRYL